MLFVERAIRRMDKDSEFSRIITNMALSIDNHNLIISKSRPIYKQYYQSELGYVSGDDFLYGMAITIMVNRARKAEMGKTEMQQAESEQHVAQHGFQSDTGRQIAQRDTGYIVQHDTEQVAQRDTKNIAKRDAEHIARGYKDGMLGWLDGLAKEDYIDDIGTLILQRISLTIKNNYGLLIDSLQELTNWEGYYSQRVAYYKKERDKERYLKGDFEKETIELKAIL
jgi:hypothetical protein